MNNTKPKPLHCPVVAEVMSDLAIENWPGIRMLEWVPTPAPVNAPK